MCGNCVPGQWCIDFTCTGSCVDDCVTPGEPSCLENGFRECGEFDDDLCLDWGDVVPCDPGLTCVGGACVCIPECEGKECGLDGCGGTCGECVGVACIVGKCGCTGDCTGRDCGWDGCDGSCGACEGSDVCDIEGQCTKSAKAGQYIVGADFHAVTIDFENSAFLAQYHVPAVRAQVVKQLQGMADAGAGLVSVRIWLAEDVGVVPDKPWKWNFPPSQQQLDNLHLFVSDASKVQGPDGEFLEVYLATHFAGCADYTVGTLETGLGECGISPDEFLLRLNETYDALLLSLAGIYRTDGRPAVTLMYVDGDVRTAAADGDPAVQWEAKNQRWFLQNAWPELADRIRGQGMVPSFYFSVAVTEDEALDNKFQDDYLPELSGHRSVFWLYRCVKFLADNSLPIPDRIDFSLYVAPPAETFGAPAVVNRVFDDVEATLAPLLGPGLGYAVAETAYPADLDRRFELGKAFASERLLRGVNPELVTFWTTPYKDGTELPCAAPFDFSIFSPAGISAAFAELNASFEADSDADGLPDSWENVSGHCVPDLWSVAKETGAGEAVDGESFLRLHMGFCMPVAMEDEVWVESDPVPATPGAAAVARFYQRNDDFPTGQQPLGNFSGPLAVLVALDADGKETVIRARGFPGGQWTWRRSVLVGKVPADAASVSLRFGTQYAPATDLDIDAVH